MSVPATPATSPFPRPSRGVDAAGAGIAVLGSKLAPPLLGHAPVIRSRLLTALSRGVAHTPVTLISGPAGSGKTVLAATWAQRTEGLPVVWLTLDAADDDPATFAVYLLSALERVGVEVSAGPLVPGEALPPGFFGRLAAEVVDRPRPIALVLDNADHLEHRAILDGLDLLARHAGTRLRLVLCARADPALPLHQYRVAGTISEIRFDQLAFTPEETRQLLAGLGAPVAPAVAEALCERTEGWAVGLRLAAAPLRRHVDPDELLQSMAADDGSVAQYLFEEVLKNQPASVRRFLLRISVLDELEPELVDRLGGRSSGRRILTGLARANAFVEQPAASPGAARIHPLFRAMLQAQLNYEMPEEAAALHRDCAAWYAEHGRIGNAVGHATAARAWPLVAELLIEDLLVRRLLTHEADPFLRGLDELPADLPGAEPAVIRAAAAMGAGQLPDDDDLARAAVAAQDPANRSSLRLSAAVTAAAGLAIRGEDSDRVTETVELAGALLATLPEERSRARREFGAVLAAARAYAELRGEASDAVLLSALGAAVAAGAKANSRKLRALALGHLALVEAVRGSLVRATELAEEARSVSAERGLGADPEPAAAAAALAWVCVERYDLTEARRWLTRAQSRPPRPGHLSVRPVLAVLQSRLLRVRHDFDTAEATLAPFLPDATVPRWMRVQLLLEAARTRAARSGFSAPEPVPAGLDGSAWALLLDPLAGRAPAADGGAAVRPLPMAEAPPAITVGSQVALCELLLAEGAEDRAVPPLHAALDQARAELMRWPFLDAPAPVRQLLRTHPELRAPGAWLRPPQAGGSGQSRNTVAPGAPSVASPVQELSERELEVLRHLAEMLSTAEIAAAMFVSVNTVRTHIRSILRKLSVGRRNQAVRRGRELGIL